MALDTSFYQRCIQTLEQAHTLLKKSNKDSIEYDMYRSACVKEFEIILEQSGKLLRKILIPYLHSPSAANKLVFKDLFRKASQHELLSLEQTERWLSYRDNRNNTAHDYGKQFADTTLKLLPTFISDAKALQKAFENHHHD